MLASFSGRFALPEEAPVLKSIMSAFLALFLSAVPALAQTPDFSGLPAAPQSQDLAALVQQLLKRVSELEHRVDALEAAQARTLTTDGDPKADPEAARLLAAAMSEKEKLSRHLDGFTRDDPKHPLIQYSRVKSTENWDAVTVDAKRFAEALTAAAAKSGGLTGDTKSSLEALIKWARGRSVFQVRHVLDAKEYLILPLDFATDVVPADGK